MAMIEVVFANPAFLKYILYLCIINNFTLSLAAVDDDILWLDPFLQHALFGVLASTPKQSRRLNFKVANALFVMVQQTVTILIHYLLVGLFQSLIFKKKI